MFQYKFAAISSVPKCDLQCMDADCGGGPGLEVAESNTTDVLTLAEGAGPAGR